MGRFLGNVLTRLGQSGDPSFTRAAVITTPGTSTFTVPSSASKVKVFVVGAGSNYRPGRYCAASSGCWSGVEQPVCNYSFDFCGHLMGAGGGYAERMYDNAAANVTLNINVGSPSFTSTAYFTNGSSTVTGISGQYRDALAVGATITASALSGSPTISTITKTDATITGSVADILVSSTVITTTNTTNVFPGNLIIGPSLVSGTLVTAVVTNTSITVSNPVQENIINGIYTVSGANITISANATTTSFTTATITGLSATSVSGTGLTTVTATNATDAVISYTCTNAVVARDISLDNPTSTGIRLPACGYQICYSGFYNVPGSGSNGTVNRTGGAGILIPEFQGDYNCIDVWGGQGASTGGASGGWTSPNILCGVVSTYSNVFGSQCCGSVFPNCYPCSCICPFVSSSITNSPTSSPLTLVNFKYLGKTQRFSMNPTTYDPFITDRDADQNVPIGLGASSGSSSGTGRAASSPDSTLNTNWGVCGNATSTPTTPTPGAAAGGAYTPASTSVYQITNYGYFYDSQFGGSLVSCVCHCQFMGCVTGSSVCGNAGANSYCYRCMGHGFSGVFGNGSSPLPCLCFLYSAGGGGSTNVCLNKCIAYSYELEAVKAAEEGTQKIFRLSDLVDQNGANLSDVAFGKGAGATPASPGGGGNRLYPAGGAGAVVILWG